MGRAGAAFCIRNPLRANNTHLSLHMMRRALKFCFKRELAFFEKLHTLSEKNGPAFASKWAFVLAQMTLLAEKKRRK